MESNTMQESEIDVDEELEKMKENYLERTGEELPDHVLENYDEFFSIGPTTTDLQTAFERGRESVRAEFTPRQLATVGALSAVVFGLLGYASGLAVGSNFGVMVIGLVAVGFGFAVGVVAAG